MNSFILPTIALGAVCTYIITKKDTKDDDRHPRIYYEMQCDTATSREDKIVCEILKNAVINNKPNTNN